MKQTQSIQKIVFSVALASSIFLILPLIAHQVFEDFNWDANDFIVAWLLVFGAGLAFKLFTRNTENVSKRIAWGMAIAALLILAWMNLAVGLIGDQGNPANLYYLAVFIVFIIGSVVAGLRPQGMWRVLLITAAVQFLIPFLALFIFHPNLSLKEDLTGMLGAIGINTIFAALFLLSASLFKNSVNYMK